MGVGGVRAMDQGTGEGVFGHGNMRPNAQLCDRQTSYTDRLVNRP